MFLYGHGIVPYITNVKITFSMLYIFACSTAYLHIPGDSFIFERDTPLILTCITAKNNSDIDFRFDNNLLGTCYHLFGCNNLGNTFTISAVTSTYHREYFLKSVNNFDATLCGTYQCTDIDTNIKESVNVSYKEFDNNSFSVEETVDALYISTACVFPASYIDLEVSWFVFDNSSLTGLNITAVDEFITVVKATSTCPDVTCNSVSANSFTFGLKFKNHSRIFSSSFVEIKIIHTLFQDKPLVWRSSKTYPMEDCVYNKNILSPAEHSGLSVGSVIGIASGVAGAILLVVIVVVLGTYIKGIRQCRCKENKHTINEHPENDRCEELASGSRRNNAADEEFEGVPTENEIVQEHTRYEDLNNLTRTQNGEYSDLEFHIQYNCEETSSSSDNIKYENLTLASKK
ncbi:uncharacterized protein LOC128233756 [Mya arenaria]|uniref:uncharacterized protein LOC128233756 n=1 Tax=Mya arenaria TaxID=6604 RepID=UPI0022E0736B|nr:uncharacterized protein LOC128233756 [Mya arenaria]